MRNAHAHPRHSFPPSGRSRRAEQAPPNHTAACSDYHSFDRFITMFSSYIVSAESAAASAYRSASCRIRSAHSQPDLRLCRAATPPYKPPEPASMPCPHSETSMPARTSPLPPFAMPGLPEVLRYAAAVRRKNAGAVSLVEHDAPIVLRELCRVRSGRVRLAAEPCELARVRREHDRLCRSPQYILMPGNRIYAVRIEYNLAGSFFEQGTHDFGQRIRTAESAPDEQRVRLFRQAQGQRLCGASGKANPFSSCGMGRTTGSFSLTASTGHAPCGTASVTTPLPMRTAPCAEKYAAPVYPAEPHTHRMRP